MLIEKRHQIALFMEPDSESSDFDIPLTPQQLTRVLTLVGIMNRPSTPRTQKLLHTLDHVGLDVVWKSVLH